MYIKLCKDKTNNALSHLLNLAFAIQISWDFDLWIIIYFSETMNCVEPMCLEWPETSFYE